MAISKEHILSQIDRLSDRDLELVSDLMERLTQLTNDREIPLDDEPTTQDDLNAIKAAEIAREKGELISLRDVEHELRN